MYNHVTLIGRVGLKPQLKQVLRPDGTQVGLVKFSVATKNPNKTTEWHQVLAWDTLATVVDKYVGKGALVCVEGSLHYNNWTDTQGVKHQKTEIVASKVVFLEPRTASTAVTPQPGPSADDVPIDDPAIGSEAPF